MADTEKKPFFDKLATYSKRSEDQSKITGATYDRRVKKDRRKLHTFIANDRRSGIADRRKQKK